MKTIIDFKQQRYEEIRRRAEITRRKTTITPLFSDLRDLNPQSPFFYSQMVKREILYHPKEYSLDYYKRIAERSSWVLKSLSFKNYGVQLANHCIYTTWTNPINSVCIRTSDDMNKFLLTFEEAWKAREVEIFRAITNDLDYAQSDPSLEWRIYHDLFKLVGRILS